MSEPENGGVVALIDGGGELLPYNSFQLLLGGQQAIPLKLIGAGILVLGVDLEEGLDVAGGGFVVLGLEGAVDAFEGVGAFHDGVDAEERVADARLGEVKLADLAADLVGEVGGGGDVGEHIVCVGVDDVEDVRGALELEEMAVEVGALRQKLVEFNVHRSLVSDAFVKEARHGANVGEGTDVLNGLRRAEIDGSTNAAPVFFVGDISVGLWNSTHHQSHSDQI